MRSPSSCSPSRRFQAVKVVQSGQGADEVFGGYFWHPRMAAASGSDLERFRRHYFDRDHAEWLDTVAPAYHGPDHSAALIAERLAGALAPIPILIRCCAWT